MRNLLTLALLTLPLAAPNALPAFPLFGTQRFTPNTAHTVTGPLVQLQTPGGSILSFQQGSQFKIDDTGTVTLTSGNLRVGPVGTTPLTLNLPQGPVTIAPLTALTVTVNGTQTTGRIYQGNLETEGRTFTTGQGFLLNASGAHGTFTPAPAQAPAPVTITALEPAAGPATSTPPTNILQPVLRPNATIQPAAQQPTTPTPPASQPEPATPQPQPEPEIQLPEPPAPEIQPEPEIEQPQPEPTPEPEITPEPEPQPEPEITPEPEPQPEPEPEVQLPELPIQLPRQNLYTTFAQEIPGVALINAYNAPTTHLISTFTNGTQTLDETSSRYLYGLTTTRLNRGSAANLNTANHGPTSGLGRWVGGDLIAITGNNVTTIANTTTVTDGETTTILPNSLHYVWGERPTAPTTPGLITYNLFAATQPTYSGTTGNTLSSEGATFTGNLAIDFSPAPGGVVGTYNFSGNVAMPTITQTETGPETTTTNYALATLPGGGVLTTALTNTGTLTVNAPTGAAACPNGCTGSLNIAAFGEGMKDIGTTYTINPGAETSINGAALFTAP